MSIYLHPKREIVYTPEAALVLPEAERPRFGLRPLTFVERCNRVDACQSDKTFKVGTYNLFTLVRGVVSLTNAPAEVQAAFRLNDDGNVDPAVFDYFEPRVLNDLVAKIDAMSTLSDVQAKV